MSHDNSKNRSNLRNINGLDTSPEPRPYTISDLAKFAVDVIVLNRPELKTDVEAASGAIRKTTHVASLADLRCALKIRRDPAVEEAPKLAEIRSKIKE